MNTGEWVMAGIAALSVVLAFISFAGGKKKDCKQETIADESMRSDVKYLVRGMDDIRADLKGQGKQLQGHERRITRLETMNNVQVDDE
jgi:hypothetical protein